MEKIEIRDMLLCEECYIALDNGEKLANVPAENWVEEDYFEIGEVYSHTCEGCGVEYDGNIYYFATEYTEGTNAPAERVACTAPATACEVPSHDHKEGDDSSENYGEAKLCEGCDAPAHWDETEQDYFHDSNETPDCFMIRTV